jgi:hypothetical protein
MGQQLHEGMPLLTLEFVLFPQTTLGAVLDGRNARAATAALQGNGMAFVVFSSSALALTSLEGRLGTLVSITPGEVAVPEGQVSVMLNALNRGRLIDLTQLSPDVRATVRTEPEPDVAELEAFEQRLLERAQKRFPDRIAYVRLVPSAEAKLNMIASWLGLTGDEQYALLSCSLRDRAEAVLAREWGAPAASSAPARFRLLAFKHWLLHPARWWVWLVFSLALCAAFLSWVWHALS